MGRASWHFKLTTLLPLLVLSACGETTYDLAIDLRTDLVGGVEFDAIRLEIDGEAQSFALDSDVSYADGVRLDDVRVESGDHQVVGSLTLAGRTVIERATTVRLDTNRGMTVLLSRSCRGVDCSSSGAAREACSAGMCVDERCTPETPEFCPLTPECSNDDDCAVGMCGYRTCAAGVCLRGDDRTCGALQYCDPDMGCLDRPVAGPVDSGVDAVIGDAGTDGTDFDAGGPQPIDDAGNDAPDTGRVCTGADGSFGCVRPAQSLRVGTGSPLTTALIGGGDWMTNDFTIEVWARLAGGVGGSGVAQLIFSHRSQQMAGFEGVLFGLLSGQLYVQLSGAPNHLSGVPSLLASGSWVHLAITRQVDELVFYENGREIARTGSVVTRDITGDMPGFLGRDSVDSSSPFNGWMHHLRLWSRALTPEEIFVVAFNPVPPDAPDLLAEYAMQGSGQVLTDSTGRHDGTLGSSAGEDVDDAVRVPF